MEERKGQDLVALPLVIDETTKAEIDFLVTVAIGRTALPLRGLAGA